jgi:dihydroorotase (multifunctional complex type)
MTVDLVIRNARCVDHAGEFEGGIACDGGRIVATCANDELPQARRVIDAEGRVLMPGVVDPHCHLGVNYPYDEDMRSETAQAARGGITTICLYIRNKGESYIPFYEERKRIGEENVLIDFGFHFGIQRIEHIHEIEEIAAKTGVQSFKLYFGYEQVNPIGIIPATDGWVFATMRKAAKLPRGVVSVHCENTEIAAWLRDEIVATGRQDLAAFTESRPSFCEEETIRRMIFLAELTGCPLQIVHTTIAAGPPIAAEARARGVDVTVETCPHYLTRTCHDPDLDMKAKISPPLRPAEDKEGLWQAMLNGQIYSLGSDHVPFFPKKGEDLWTEKPGIVSFPWELPLMLHEGVHKRGLSLQRLSQLNSWAPAKRFGWHDKGALRVGMDADLVLVDLDLEREVTHTGNGHCIWEGWKLKGWPVLTVSRGRVVYEDGAVDESQFGKGRCINLPEA